MEYGPHIIPLVPGGVPVVIHLSQNEYGEEFLLFNNSERRYIPGVMDISFLLLNEDNTYYTFTPNLGNYKGIANNYKGDNKPGRLHYVRPDGETGDVELLLENQTVKGNHDDLNLFRYINSHDIHTRGIPKHLTELAGDVRCEILLYGASDPEQVVARTANFIIRVEPSVEESFVPTVIKNGSGGGTGGSGESEADFLSWLITI